jgi:energy-coupling factor transporter ATP-binding protein EcfA2
VRDDLAELFVGNLLTPEAVSAPIVVLGHPGSGKSVLTRVLAARLPPDQFIAVRVPLREVPADADLQEQIESAIRLSTGVTASWPVLAGQTGGALPVILLDGFDELLQATGVNQSDYLLKIADFQRRETEQGRAAAVIVTSRITAADRARIPRDTLALRLEPFSDVQIKQWLRVWNRTNDAYFTLTGIAPFVFRFTLSYKELSTQPLLLLMLAIYDADANGLQEQGARELTEGQLYEKLLLRFAYREVTKVGLCNSEAEVATSVEDELTRISIIALAMFNRGAQSATEQEIDNDLVSLLGRRAVPQDRTDFRVQLGQAERALGRFFFIQRLTANRGGRELATYEFLHATFAEYLVARLIWKELEYLRRRLELSTHAVLIQTALDDSNLYKLMSYSALCIRTPILKFVADFARDLNVERRAEITGVVLAVLSTGMTRESDPPGNTYSPSVTNPVRRRAIYSVNLVLLAMLVCEELRISQLFSEVDDPAREWRCQTLLWQSQLRDDKWSSLLECMTVLRKPVLINGARDAIIRPADGRYGRFHSLT